MEIQIQRSKFATQKKSEYQKVNVMGKVLKIGLVSQLFSLVFSYLELVCRFTFRLGYLT